MLEAKQKTLLITLILFNILAARNFRNSGRQILKDRQKKGWKVKSIYNLLQIFPSVQVISKKTFKAPLLIIYLFGIEASHDLTAIQCYDYHGFFFGTDQHYPFTIFIQPLQFTLILQLLLQPDCRKSSLAQLDTWFKEKLVSSILYLGANLPKAMHWPADGKCQFSE